MLAAPPAPVETLPAHRIALRAALRGATGCVATVAVALPLALLSSRHEAPFLTCLAAGSGVAMGAFFTVAVEMTRRLPAAVRLAAMIALGALSPAFVMCALIWVYHLADGVGPERAWLEILEFLEKVLLERPERSLPATAAVLIPFAVAGAAHAGGLPGLLERTPSTSRRVALATITGAVGLAIVWSSYAPPERVRVLLFGFLFTPPALEVAFALALRVEARLLTRWAKRREAA